MEKLETFHSRNLITSEENVDKESRKVGSYCIILVIYSC